MLTPLRCVKKLIRSWFNPRKPEITRRKQAAIQVWLESLEERLAPAGNILVSNGDLNAQIQHLQEYTPSGTLLRSINIPPANADPFDQARDLAEDPSGNIYIYDGTFTPALAIYNPTTNSWTQQTFAGWNTVADTSYGGLTYYQGNVYAADELIGNDPPGANGIVRFNVATGTFTRFYSGNDFINVNIGLDGMLYALGTPGLDVINPSTMALVRTVSLNSNHDIRGVAVNAAGDVYTANWDNSVSHFSSTGTDLADLSTSEGSDDIDIAPDGTVIVGSNGGLIYELTSSLTLTNTINTGSGSAVFVKFATPTETTTTLTSSKPTASYGTPVTFTATVTALSAAPTGNVEFFDNTTGADLGPGTLQSSSPGTSTWTYVTSPTQLQASATAQTIGAVFTSSTFLGSSAQLQGGETVSPLTLTVTGVTANNKVYDGTVAATVNTAGATLVGVFAGDSATLSTAGAAGSFASKNVGNNIPVSISGLALSGPQAADYALGTGSLTVTGNIAPAPLSAAGLGVSNKVYDGTTAATLNSGGASLSGIVKSDAVTLVTTEAMATFASTSAGTAIPVALFGLSLTGAQAADYSLTPPALTANITPAPLTVTGVTAANKVYDGTTKVNFTVGTPALVGVLPGDTVSLTVGTVAGSFVTKDVGTNVPVNLSGLTLGGPQASDYSLPTLSANITPLSINVSGVTANNKVYDSTTRATLNVAGVVLSGVIPGDSVTLGATGTFASKDAGANISVAVTGLTLSGPQGGDYTPVLNQPPITANITSAPLAVSGVTAATKVYDGTTNETLNLAGAALAGTIYTGDAVTLVKSGAVGVFASNNVSTAIPVTVSGLTLGGAQAGDYALAQPTLSANITPVHLALTGVTATTKVYDGTTQASLIAANAALVGVLPGDSATLTITTPTGTFASKNVGNNISVVLSGLTLGGPQASDYTLPTLTANITPLPINVSGLTANNKVYNATTAATPNLAGAVLSGLVTGDAVTLQSATGTFASKDVGTNIPVTVTNLTLGGAQASDYTPVLNQSAPTANITPATLTVTKIVANKVYDGTTVATLTPAAAALAGVFSGDSVTLITSGATGTFASKNVGTNIPVALTGLALGGPQSGDYSLTPTSTANITAAPVTVTGITASNKLYDGTTSATINLNSATLVGVVNGDSVSLVIAGVTGAFASAGPGNNIAVTVTGLTLSGVQAADYSLTSPALTANILARPDVSDGGTGVLTISLGANQTLGIVSLGTSYTFTSNQPFGPTSGTDPASQSSAFSGFNTTTLTITSAGLAQYTGVNIIDAGAGASITFNNSSGPYANNFTVTLSNPAAGSIAFNGNSSFGAFSLQASTTRNILLNTNASLTSVSGNIWLQANQQATPTSGNFVGVTINGATLRSTGSGSITLVGTGGTSADSQYGVYIEGAALISGGTGTLTITGIGGLSPGGSVDGVYVNGSGPNATVTSSGGNVIITGTGGGTGNGSNDYGVDVASVVTAGGGGNVTIMGTGGQGGGSGNNQGVYIASGGSASGGSASGGSASVTSSGGNVSVIGQGGGGDAVGVVIATGGQVNAGGTGSVTVTGTGSINSVTSDTFRAYGVFLGGNTANSAVITSSGGNVQVTGNGGTAGAQYDYGVNVSAGGLITAGGQGTVSVTGTGGYAPSGSNAGVLVSGNTGLAATITSGGGNVQVTGHGGDTGPALPNSFTQFDVGVSVGTEGLISAGGAGTVTVTGTGGGYNGYASYGVYLTGQNANSAVITSSGGNVSITGQGGYDAVGVSLESGGLVTAGGQGTVTVSGTGGRGDGGLDGVNLNNEFSGVDTITSNGGNVQVTGVGGVGSGGSNGVYVGGGGTVTAGGAGTVTVQGTGGAGNGGGNTGVLVTNGAALGNITSSGGAVQVSGVGGSTGTGGSNEGVNVNSGGVITAGGNGNVTVQGTGGLTPEGDNYGVSIDDGNYQGTKVTSPGGNVTVVGTGGGQGQSSFNTGLQVTYGALVSSGGSGNVTLQGTGGPSTGTNNGGVLINDGNLGRAAVSSGGGNVVIDGTATCTSALAISMAGYRISTAPTGGAVTLVGDSMSFSQGTINAGTHVVSVDTMTSGVSINLGGGNAPGTLGLTGAEISEITAGTLNIGNASGGAITISAALTVTGAPNLNITSGGNIVFNPGSLTASGAVVLATGPSGAVEPLASGTDVSAASLTFAPGSALAIAINGSSAGTQYNQFSVSGGVNLDGANLVLSGSLVPVNGQSFTILNNKGSSLPTGTFQGLSQGSAIPNFLGSRLGTVLSYFGGDGNDVVLNVGQQTGSATTTTVGSSAPVITYGQSVTFTATVSAGSVTPTGAVQFFDDTTGAYLGSGTLQSSGPSGGVWTCTTGPTQLQATGGSADGIRAVYVPAGAFISSTALLPGGETVNPFALQVSNVMANSKVYDSTTAASLSVGNASLVGVFAGDTVTVSGGTGTFASKDVGTNIPVIPSFTLSGPQAGDYTAVLSQPSLTANITPALIAVTGIKANNKVYDGTTAATLDTSSAALAGGVYQGDVVTLDTSRATATFPRKDAGASIPVTVSGLALGGGQASDYLLRQPGITAQITRAPVSVTGILAPDKVYDGTATVTLDTSGAMLAGVIGIDVLNLDAANAVGTAANKDVGTNIGVTITGLALQGLINDYVLTPPSPFTTNITPAPLTLTGIKADKVYDGTTSATLNFSGAILNTFPGDAVTLATSGVTATFASKDAANNINVSVQGLTLTGAQTGDYMLTPLTLTASIMPAPLTITGVSAASKVYNANTAATLNATNAALAGTIYPGDVVSLLVNSPAGTFATKNAGNNILIVLSGFSLTGAPASDYMLTPPQVTANITPAPLTVTGVSANNKTYNGTTAATLTTSGAVLMGALSGDNVSLVTSGATANFATKNVGNSIPVTITGLTLGAAQAGDYILTQQPTATANITPKTLSVTGITAASRVYDTTTTATLNTAGGALTGVLAGDTVLLIKSGITGAFNTKDVGTGKPITISGLALSGAQAADYALTQPALTANITPAPLTLAGVTAANKVYDGTTQASLTVGAVALQGVLPGDSLTFTIATLTGSFATKNAGTNIPVLLSGFTLGGAQAGDYSGPNVTATITRLSVNVSGLTANNEVYNATTTATLNIAGVVLSGVLSGDAVTLQSATGTFANQNVGTNIPVTVTNMTLGGAQGIDYTPVLNQPAPTANITPAPLTVTNIVANKTYDGTTMATLTPATAVLPGVLRNDSVSLITSGAAGTFANKNVGTNILVNLTGLALGGAQGGNYSLTPTSTANITAAPLTVTGITANNKLYDATTSATLSLGSAALLGVVSGDSVTLVTSGATGIFASAGPGNSIAVTISGLTLSGAQASDYSLTPLALTANIVAIPNVSDGGTGILTISLGTNQNLAIASLGTSYTLTSNQLFGITSATDPTNQSTAFTGFNTTTLTLTSAGLAQYSGIDIIDVRAGASVTFNNSSGSYANNFTVTLSNPAAGAITFNGNSAFGPYNLRATTTSNIALNTGASLTSSSGNMMLQANQQATPTTGSFAGVTINGATLMSTASGTITVLGRGGTSGNAQDGVYVEGSSLISGGTGALTLSGAGGVTPGGYADGVNVSGSNTTGPTITSIGGDVVLTGTGGGAGVNSGPDFGVYIASIVQAGGQGNVAIAGTGGQGGSDGNIGVYVGTAYVGTGTAATPTVTSAGGDVTISGQGGMGSYAHGVAIDTGGEISAGGHGNVKVTGTGDSDPDPGDIFDAYGVYVLGNSSNSGVITSSGGNVQVIGTGGITQGVDYGVFVAGGGLITAGAQGSVSVIGTGGTSYSGSDFGVYVGGNSSLAATITSGGGNVQVTGNGGDSTILPQSELQFNMGVSVDTLGTISAGGMGSVIVNGTGGGGGHANNGVYLDASGAVITSSGGEISIVGQKAVDGVGVYINPGNTLSSGGGAITLHADTMLFTQSTIDAATGAVNLEPLTAGTSINLGAGSAQGTLVLTGADLSAITAGTLAIGDAGSGTINISNPLVLTTATNLHLTSGGNIAFLSGSITAPGTVVLATGPSGLVEPLTNNTDVSAASLNFAPNSTLAIVISGTTAGTQYNQLNVVGGVNLTGVNLRLSGAFVPSNGQSYTIISDQGTTPTRGNFNGLPDGSAMTNFLGSGLSAVIDYFGGNGASVVLSVGPQTRTTTTTALDTSAPVVTYGSSVTFTATVTSASGTPAGSVEFYDGTTGADLGAGILQTSGAGAAVWTYATGPMQLQATGGSPDTIRAVYYPSGNFISSTATLSVGQTVRPVVLTVTGVQASNKVYDSTTTATLNLSSASLTGVFPGDSVTVTAGTGTFASKDVANNIPVMATSFTLGGPQAADYTAVLSQALLTANITPAPLTVTGVTANNKTYNGTTAATLTTSGAVLMGALSGDTVSLVTTGATANFASKEVGSALPVAITGLTVGGPQGSDYVLAQQPTATANITPLAIGVTGITALNKVYDATTAATLNLAGAALSGVIAGDTVSLNTFGATGTFSTKDVGSRTVTVSGLTLSGAQAADYSLIPPVPRASITPLAVTITGLTVLNKVYDGTPNATLVVGNVTIGGVFSGDTVTIAVGTPTGNFASPIVGNKIPVTVSGITLGGPQATDYSLSFTANITPLPVTVSGLIANNKSYDGTTTTTFNTNSAVVQGLLLGATAGLAPGITGTFASKDVGTSIPVTASGLSLLGQQAPNYVVIPPILAANITPAPLTVTGITVNPKLYDGTTVAYLDASKAALAGTIYSGDSVALLTSGATGTFAHSGVGNNIPVTVSGLALGGAQAGDYAVVQPTTTGNILGTAAVLSDGRTNVLTIALATNQSLSVSVLTNGTGYSFSSNFPFVAATGQDPANQTTAFSGLGQGGFTLTSAGLAQYTGINVIDTGANSSVTINGGFGSNVVSSYPTNLSVVLGNVAAGAIKFQGNMNFGSHSLQASTTGGIWVAGGSVTSGDGNITLQSYLQSTPTIGNFDVLIDDATVQSTGSGQITLQGGGGATSTSAPALWLFNGNVFGGTGNVVLSGTGGAGNGSTGVMVNGAITSNGGNVEVTGLGGGFPNSFPGDGVYINEGTISAGGAGNVIVQGTGGATGAYGGTGVFLDGPHTAITSAGGNVQITGQGGGPATGAGSVGVGLADDAMVTAGGSGDVSIQGTGGATGGGMDYGVDVSGATITSSGGNVLVSGTGGGSGSGGQNEEGVLVTPSPGLNPTSGTISAGGTGTVTVQGTGGTTQGSGNNGVDLSSGTITSSGGNIQITGAAQSSGSTSIIDSGTINTPVGEGNITLTGDSMALTGTVSAVGQVVTLAPLTSGTQINLGGDDAPGTLGLTTSELGEIAAGTLQIGSATSGAITMSAPIIFPQATNVNLASGSDIVFNPGSINTAGGALTLAPGATGAVRPLASGTDVTVTPAALAFASGSSLAVAINGTTADSQYNQLSVLGDVNLTGVNLVLSGNFTPIVGQTFTIVNNQGSDPIVGTFAGLPQGAIIPNFLGSPLGSVISYVGGDGNDVVLTVTVVPNPPMPRIGNRSMLEGTSGLTPFVFQVSLAAAAPQPITYDVYTTDGAALSVGTNPNFVAIAPGVNGPNSTGTVAFAPGQVARTVTVYVVAGTMPLSGGGRTFFVTLSSPAMATVPLATATGTIIPQGTSGGSTGGGALSTPRIGSVQALEGPTGFTPFTFHVSLPVAPAQSVTYDVYTTAGTAFAGTNYAAINAGDNNPPHDVGTITFAPGQVSQTVTVYVIAGSIPVSAGSKTFFVNLSNPVSPAAPLVTGTGTIIPQAALAATGGNTIAVSLNEPNPAVAAVFAQATAGGAIVPQNALVDSAPVGAPATEAVSWYIGPVLAEVSTTALDEVFADLGNCGFKSFLLEQGLAGFAGFRTGNLAHRGDPLGL